MTVFRKLVALCIIIFIVLPVGTATLFFVSISTWAFDRNFYTGIFDNDKLYEVLLTEEIPNSFTSGSRNEPIPDAAIVASMREIITPEYLRATVTTIVDDFFDFIDGIDPIFDPIMDIRPIKTALQGEGGTQFAHTFAQNLEPCPAGETGRENSTIPYTCLPAGVTADDAAAVIQENLDEWLNTLPDELHIMDSPSNLKADFFASAGTNGYVIGDSPRAAVMNAVTSLLILTLVFWLVAGFMGGDHMRGRLFWLGAMLVILAMPSFLLGIGMRGALNNVVINTITTGSFNSEALDYVMRDIFLDAVNWIVRSFMTINGVILAIGTALYVWGLVTKRPMTEDEYYPAKGKPKYEYDGMR